MSYGVTPKGFITKPFSAIVQKIVDDAKANPDLAELPTNPESVAGQFINIIAASIKDTWDLTEASATTQNRTTAEGAYLDFLARLAGLTRIRESGSTGQLLLVGDQNTFIPQFTACSDDEGRVVLTQKEHTLNRANCYNTTFGLQRVREQEDYTIIIEGLEVTYTSGLGATTESIINGLYTQINANTDYVATLNESSTEVTVTYSSYNNELTTTNSDSVSLVSIGSLVSAESVLTGLEVNFDANTIQTLINSILGITSVINLTNFQNGRERETDEELRIRMDEREESTGNATKPSIETALSQVEGVTGALVIVNDDLIDDTTTGVPAKHFETFITGGDDNEIAEVLWRTKSLFGNMHGDIHKLIVDENGDTQGVRYSRPATDYAWVRVTYAINSEEQFPSDGETRMRNEVASFGTAMIQGEDLEPTKFFAPLYKVQGVYIQPNIQVAITDTVDGTPAWSSTRLPVTSTENLLFDASRVIITT
ncbi:baseplate protein J-like protein [Vibrio phage 1.121.O._10N.286.46.C4]|nr:baseplate protein J-like protein [Vibrio phage 1.121.O._10N.286.46.C4]